MSFLFNPWFFLSLMTSTLHTNVELFSKITIFQFKILAALMDAELSDAVPLLFYLSLWNILTFDIKLFYIFNLYLMRYFAFWYSILSLGSKSFSFILHHDCNIANLHDKSVFIYKSAFNCELIEFPFNRKKFWIAILWCTQKTLIYGMLRKDNLVKAFSKFPKYSQNQKAIHASLMCL